jgi:hypothetical protein
MVRHLLALLLFLSACFLSACGPPLPNPYEVKDLRAVAVIFERPEISAGETTPVDVYFADPDSDDRQVSAFAYRCADADDAQCLVAKEAPAEQSETITAERVLPDLYRARFTYTAAADVFATAGPLAQFYGIDLPFVVRGDDGVRVTDVLKRIVISSPRSTQPKNTNPRMEGFSLSVGDVAIGDARDTDVLSRGTEYTLSPLYDATSLETYSVVDYNQKVQTFDEEASFSWSCSPACKMDQRVTYGADVVKVTPPEEGVPSNRFTLHVVMRDGRGGEALFVKTFTLTLGVRTF